MKILVTGGGGFIGLALVRRLVEEGHDVRSFSRKEYPEHKQLGVKSICGDLADFEDTVEACRGMEVVFHVAGKVSVWGSYSEFYRSNVLGTQNMIRSSLQQGVRTFIFTSSASVIFGGDHLEGVDESHPYPESPLSNYASTKAQAEQVVLNANSEQLRTISLRPHIVWGPGDTQLTPKIIERARSGKLRRPGKKDYLIDITYIDNFIDAQLLALKKMGESREVCGRAFFITNGEPIKTWEFITATIESAGIQVVHKSLPRSVALFAAWLMELFYRISGKNEEPMITRFIVKELSTHHWFNISAAKNELGYSCRVHFREGMERISSAFSS
ncbi:MAG: NAD-dependent epimerase/dehydratase family protein [Bacteroidales bacterium]|nr:NAD-dependent epimerase/dehydratase family protein [Bacteroidales bacterium]